MIAALRLVCGILQLEKRKRASHLLDGVTLAGVCRTDMEVNCLPDVQEFCLPDRAGFTTRSFAQGEAPHLLEVVP